MCQSVPVKYLGSIPLERVITMGLGESARGIHSALQLSYVEVICALDVSRAALRELTLSEFGAMLQIDYPDMFHRIADWKSLRTVMDRVGRPALEALQASMDQGFSEPAIPLNWWKTDTHALLPLSRKKTLRVTAAVTERAQGFWVQRLAGAMVQHACEQSLDLSCAVDCNTVRRNEKLDKKAREGMMNICIKLDVGLKAAQETHKFGDDVMEHVISRFVSGSEAVDNS